MANHYDTALDLIDLTGWFETYADVKSTEVSEIRIKDCPICGNEKHKLYVNVEKRLWNCKVCDWGRGLKDFTVLMARVSGRPIFDVRKELLSTVPPAPTGDISQLINQAFDGEEAEEEDDNEFPHISPPGHPLSIFKDNPIIEDYADKRGLYEAQRTKFSVLGAAKLHTSNGTEMRGPFLVFPVPFANKIVSWQGRQVLPKNPKYISAPNIKHWLYPFNETFFSLYKGTVYLVEGVFDAIGMLLLGYPALCTFGTSISGKQIRLLRELKPKRVCLAWDLTASKEVNRAVDQIANQFPQTYIAMKQASIGETKLDAGEALINVDAAKWVHENVESAIDVKSVDFFVWRMSQYG